MNTFTDMRAPLSHLEDRLEDVDTEFFLENEPIKSTFVNASNVGEAMDRLAKVENFEDQYTSLALSAIVKYEMPITRYHNDTTTISFYGEYDIDKMELSEEEKETLLHIEKGYNKDNRPGSNQVVVGQVTNEYGIPMVSKTLDGATSDVKWNRMAIEYVQQLQSSGFKQGVFVADSKLMTEEDITTMNNPDSPIQFVSRCPANFNEKLESRMIFKAYENGQWQEMGTYGKGKDATGYKGISFIEEVYGTPTRLLVLESDTLKHSAEAAFLKKEAELKSLIESLEKTKWACQEDAENEKNRFLTKKTLAYFDCDIQIEKQVTEKWPRGRRGPKTKPQLEESYHLHVAAVSKNETICRDFMYTESCIVLISNVIEGMNDDELIKTYKGQHIVENSFRALKSPQLASVIYLKKPGRVKVLTMLLTFSLLVRALIQYRLRVGLKDYTEKNPQVVLRAGWGGRILERPTFKLFYEHAVNCYFERISWNEYRFEWPTVETRVRVEPLLMLLGLSLKQLIE